jgi:glycerophosphoryl diester phosphodiesterase
MSHEIGVRVVTWTVDEPVVMRSLLDAGVDAIITDRPDVLREVLVSRDQWAPMTAMHRASGKRSDFSAESFG